MEPKIAASEANSRRGAAHFLSSSSSHVRFQKKMRLVTLEIPEPGATRAC
jgi:hypothetical protein